MKSQYSPKHNILESISRFFDGLDETPRKVVLGGLIFVFLMAASITLVIAYYVYEPKITAWLHKSSPTQGISQSAIQYPTQYATQPPTQVPTQVSLPLQPVQVDLPAQTASCAGASLQLGVTSWSLESIQLAADGSADVPDDTPGVAYWIQNLANNTVFALSPTQENLDLLSVLQGGEQATITWQDYNTATYTLFIPQYGSPDTDIFADQVSIGLVVYLPERVSLPGIWVQGSLAGETIIAPPTPAPYEGEVNAEISLLETSTSDDQQTIQVVISILNYGSEPITLVAGDVSLTLEGGTSLQISSSDPPLPQQIEPAKSRTFTLIFARPETGTAMLKIFTVEYDLEGY
jgi:hypothetical protein